MPSKATPEKAKPATSKRKKAPVAPAPTPAVRTAPKKSPFGVSTIIMVVVFLGLIVAMILINRKKEAAATQATPTAGTAYVFSAADGAISSFKVEAQDGSAVELTRDSKNAWGLTLPEKVEADPSAAEAAVTQVQALTIVSSEIKGSDLSVYGLDKPAYTITVIFADGKSHTLEIGDSTPINSGYYARLDKKSLLIVSLSGIDTLTQMISYPPYLSTPTPLPPTATPTTQIAITPTP
ncbi:MAG: DUF4340 domain-containing protein [Anaerolineales bacterium]|nr:DUF4340 domain-containing protein [Anaerolineales bacterium]